MTWISIQVTIYFEGNKIVWSNIHPNHWKNQRNSPILRAITPIPLLVVQLIALVRVSGAPGNSRPSRNSWDSRPSRLSWAGWWRAGVRGWRGRRRRWGTVRAKWWLNGDQVVAVTSENMWLKIKHVKPWRVRQKTRLPSLTTFRYSLFGTNRPHSLLSLISLL